MFSRTLSFLISQRNTVNPSLTIARNYAYKSDLKIKWVRPEKISCIDPKKSGDLDKIEFPNTNEFLIGFEKSEELKKADEMIKELFTLEKSKRKDKVELYKQGLMGTVQRHQLDMGSHEVKSK
jgi:small subunit ribosomal protein S15